MVEYAYAVGRVRAIEAHLLDENKIIRMSDAKDYEAAFLVLRESPFYSALIERLEHPFDFEKLLELDLESSRDLVNKLAPENRLIQAIWKKYDPNISLGDYLKLLSAVAQSSNSDLFKKYAAAFTVLNRLKLQLLQEKFEPDNVTLKYKHTDFDKVVQTGMENFRKSGSLFVLEREIDNYLLGAVKKAKYMVFGIEPLIGFSIAKEIENKIIRLVLTGKMMHLKPEEIKERLRLPYA